MISINKNLTRTKIIVATLLLLIFLLVFSKRSLRIYSPGQKTILIKNGAERLIFKYEVLALLDGTNQARMSSAEDPVTRDILRKDDFGLFHLVTTFVPFDNEDVRKNLLIHDEDPPTDQQVEARMAEVVDCLQKNLNHKVISFVHVLVLREETINYLQSLELSNSYKLIIHKNEESPTLMHEVNYATKYLEGKAVIISHQDNYLDGGWEKVNHTVLKTKRLLYAITRHPSPSKCSATTTAAHCGQDYPYMGSHDTFVFYVSRALPSHKLVEIDVTPNMSGIENVLIWIFRRRFQYKVMNPCKVLIVHHSHCVSIREMGRERINVRGKNALVYFTDQLE